MTFLQLLDKYDSPALSLKYFWVILAGKYAQVTNNPENDGCINAVLLVWGLLPTEFLVWALPFCLFEGYDPQFLVRAIMTMLYFIICCFACSVNYTCFPFSLHGAGIMGTVVVYHLLSPISRCVLGSYTPLIGLFSLHAKLWKVSFNKNWKFWW